MTTPPLPPPNSGPPPPPPSYGPPPGPLTPPPAAQPGGNKKLLYGLLGCGALFVLVIIIGAAASDGKSGTPTTVSSPLSVENRAESSTTATTVAPTTTAPEYTPTPADFGLEVIELSRSCFGSAGCSITYKINPTYIGQPTKASKAYTVIYEVRGGDDVKVGNFKVRGSDATMPSQEFISTPSNPTLTAQVTKIVF